LGLWLVPTPRVVVIVPPAQARPISTTPKVADSVVEHHAGRMMEGGTARGTGVLKSLQDKRLRRLFGSRSWRGLRRAKISAIVFRDFPRFPFSRNPLPGKQLLRPRHRSQRGAEEKIVSAS
jgi:hypothetical protein